MQTTSSKLSQLKEPRSLKIIVTVMKVTKIFQLFLEDTVTLLNNKKSAKGEDKKSSTEKKQDKNNGDRRKTKTEDQQQSQHNNHIKNSRFWITAVSKQPHLIVN